MPLFLPYLTGINPPEYYQDAKGAFLRLTLDHDGFDMAYAIMEGVANLLRNNIEYCLAALGRMDLVVSSGGGEISFLDSA